MLLRIQWTSAAHKTNNRGLLYVLCCDNTYVPEYLEREVQENRVSSVSDDPCGSVERAFFLAGHVQVILCRGLHRTVTYCNEATAHRFSCQQTRGLLKRREVKSAAVNGLSNRWAGLASACSPMGVHAFVRDFVGRTSSCEDGASHAGKTYLL